MKYTDYKEMLKEDRNSYGTNKSHFCLYIVNDGYKVITHLRRCHFLKNKKMLFPLYILEKVRYRRICIKYGCDIPTSVLVGKGFKIDHPWGIVINSKTVIGDNCNIKTGVVIGKNDKGVPKLKNNILVGAHALIIGDVTIESNVKIGAGAIVVKNVKENSTVISEAAHQINK